jgi:hypothetical protein
VADAGKIINPDLERFYAARPQPRGRGHGRKPPGPLNQDLDDFERATPDRERNSARAVRAERDRPPTRPTRPPVVRLAPAGSGHLRFTWVSAADSRTLANRPLGEVPSLADDGCWVVR